MARTSAGGIQPSEVQNSVHTYAEDAQASDSYAITLTPAVSAYTAGQMFVFKANTANTGVASLNVNALGAKTIKKHNTDDLANNDIKEDSIVSVVYDGTNFQMISMLSNAPAGSGDMTKAVYDTNDDGKVNEASAVEGTGVKSTGEAGGTKFLREDGDGTCSWQVATATIADDSITYAKIQNISATSRVLGRITAGAGDTEELTGANIRTIANVADGANAYVHPNHSGDVTSVADGAQTIANGAVTLAKQANVDTATVFYRKTAGAGAPEVQTLATLKTDLGLTGTNSGDQTLPTRDSLGLDTDDSPQFTAVNIGHASDTTIARVSAGIASIEGNNIITANTTASDTVIGIVELATTAETNTGTSTTLAVTPDGLAGSVHGTKTVAIQVFDGTTNVTVGDGKAYLMVPEALNGMDVIRATARVITAGTTNATTIDIYNVTDSVDILSTAISIASAGTLATAGTVNTANDSLATNDLLRIDVTSVSTTAPKGLIVVIEARLP